MQRCIGCAGARNLDAAKIHHYSHLQFILHWREAESVTEADTEYYVALQEEGKVVASTHSRSDPATRGREQ